MPPTIRFPGRRRAGALAIAVSLVAGAEGLRNYAYEDPVGIPTICFGETRGVKMGDHKTTEECKQMLGTRLVEFSAGVDKCLTRPVPDESYAAFLSFAYNVGTGNFCKSSVARKANVGDLAGACDALLQWTKAGGVELPGLVKRRQDERALCLKGVKEG